MTEDPRATETRRRLIEATIETIRTQGIAKLSARTIAATGKVNQALIFYHFGSVDKLLGEACMASAGERVDEFRERLQTVTTFAGLVEVGRDLHAEEQTRGNVKVLAQMLSASQNNPELAEFTGKAIRLWTAEVEQVLRRLLTGSAFDGIVDPPVLAQVVSASFVGLEMVDATDDSETPMAGLDQLKTFAEAIDGLGPIAKRAVRSTLKPR